MPNRFNPDIHHRKSIRLPGYDYSRNRVYFITICSQDRECLFGGVADGGMKLNENGRVVRDEWLKTAVIRPDVELDTFVVMPNHFHGIIDNTNYCRGTARRAPTVEDFGHPVPGSIPTIIRSFKSAATRRINLIRNSPGERLWQRNYYEHIIRNEKNLHTIRNYIETNPIKWQEDPENPKNIRPM